ncbi:FMN-binding negative transcriptional regulator [Gilvibacter sp.]|uniref:FMN-binding negative transcriptional regulator n=1 Tax=Gilvibacter sp. TaxID=2729997 RepID=UPI003F49B536
MYIPALFKETNHAKITEFLKSNAFGLLITQHDGKPLATHLPLEYLEKDGKAYLQGHLAKRNVQWESFDQQGEVLAVFNGPHSYVSASWYSIEEVSTWNYVAVHIYGKLRTMDQEELMPMLEGLMAKYEADVDEPIDMSKLSKKTLNQVYGIVGFEIEITDIQAKYKMSQNRSEKDYENIIDQLEDDRGTQSAETAKLMRVFKPDLDGNA